MSNSEKFLNAFSAIESHLRKLARNDRYLSLYELVNKLTQTNPVVRNLERDLKEYADLRNAIVHERGGGEIIAEPNDYAVNAIEKIASLLIKPPAVYPTFQARVERRNTSDPIGEAVKIMWEESYSQLPIVRDGKFVALLTTNTIARWLGAQVAKDLFSLQETQIEEVLRFAENSDNHAFLGKNATIFDAIGLFQDYETRGKKLESILITERGARDDRILGIITVSDLPRAYAQIEKLPR